ncbi:flagellar hook protein FlgE [Marivivens donghaensis]|uniref:flagellar hook protein FlgE n=1 Tax=Marivivens donghaensis TaxID=1699413 RepID=UPI00201F9E84|nr:flagellar hook protein FlgE [Marivivens donghaensis]MCL7408436.1 flagellar hook protein FlgE [Marivivens donghaensis]MDN3704793.1 flagellar hook protein FlgE [Marivivens donghaensis]
MSMTTALSGLMAAQSDIATTSHNISNAGTNAFRKSRAEFSDDYYSAPMNAFRTVTGSGTHLSRVSTQFGQGNFVATGQTLDIAIQGAGFFAVSPQLSDRDEVVDINYTRNGAFSIDAEGLVADSSGRALLAYPVADDGSILEMSAQSLSPVSIPLSFGEVARTTEINLAVNMPRGEDMLGQQDAVPATNAFDSTNPTTYAFSSPIPMMDENGQTIEARAYFVRSKSPDATDPTTEYQMHLFVDGSEYPSTGATTPATMVFDEAGEVDATTPLTFALAGVDYIVNTDGSRLRDLPFSVASVQENGVREIGLSSLEVDAGGVIWGSYGSQARLALGRIALADFANPQGLRQGGNTSFEETSDSGRPNFSAAGESGFGRLQSGMLERSNVDLTEELVNLISAQRNYQANAKAMETSSSLMQTILQIRS